MPGRGERGRKLRGCAFDRDVQGASRAGVLESWPSWQQGRKTGVDDAPTGQGQAPDGLLPRANASTNPLTIAAGGAAVSASIDVDGGVSLEHP
jgi:hypothetical protein